MSENFVDLGNTTDVKRESIKFAVTTAVLMIGGERCYNVSIIRNRQQVIEKIQFTYNNVNYEFNANQLQ